MEAFGKEMESKFGPEFEKKMEAFGKEMESKFGPEFEKKMEAFGKEMESKFGPGSEFEKTMKAFGKEMESKFGPDSEFVRKAKEQAGADSKPDEAQEASGRPKPSRKPKIANGSFASSSWKPRSASSWKRSRPSRPTEESMSSHNALCGQYR